MIVCVAATCALFARWGLYADQGQHYDAFWRFAAKACTQPITEEFFRLGEGREGKCCNQAGNPKALSGQNSCDAHLTPVPSQRIVAMNDARALMRSRGVCDQNGEAGCRASLLRVLRFVQDSS